MSFDPAVTAFLNGSPFAVVGASEDRSKYGNKVLRAYQQRGWSVYPVNPRADEVEGLTAYASLTDLPVKPHGVSIITPPPVTEKIVDEAIRLGIQHLWMQPGAESQPAVDRALAANINVIPGNACLLVIAGYTER